MGEAERLHWENERRRLADLRPQEDNPRYIGKDGAKRLETSWDDYGQVDALAVGPDGSIYNGHQRYYVLLDRHGPDFEVDVRVASWSLSRREWQRLTVLLHEGAVGDWDFDGLANWDGVDVGDLVDWGFDPAALGIEDWGKEEPPADPGAQIDKAAELQEKWSTALGQVWEVGRHRIVCGDCTDATVVEAVMQGEKAGLAIADPPYNVGINYGDASDDQRTDSDYASFSAAWFSELQNVTGRQIVTPGGINHILWASWFPSTHCGAWIKTNALTRGRVSNSWCWEPLFFHGEDWPKRRANDVFDYPIGMQAGIAGHPCPKPCKLWIDLIENYSDVGQSVLDPFLGSGTTLVACEQLGRIGRGIELSPAYVAVSLERLAGIGLEPKLVRTA